jgi:transposase
MKSGPDRRYTAEFRDAAVKQVIEAGRSVAAVARSLEMSNKSLANWVYRARKGQEAVKRAPAQPVSELQGELSRLRQENAKLKLEKEILKNRLRGAPRPFWIETSSVYTASASGQRPLAFWRH